MLKNMPKKMAIASFIFLSTGLFVSCTKDSVVNDVMVASSQETNTTSTTPPASNSNSSSTTPPPPPPASGSSSASGSNTSSSGTSAYSPSATWNSRPNGPYTLAQATLDFKNVVTGWDQNRMQIIGGKLRTTLLANVVGPDGGLVSWIDIADGAEYQLQFDMMFDNNFDFSAGGKVGFGFLLGAGYTGGQPASDGNGGSARIMWYKSGGRSSLKPYIYHKDQPGQYGDDFAKTYPATGSIAKGQWHTVKIYVKSNTGSNTDGRLQVSINGTTLLDKAMRWTTNDAKRLINRICFETFRGGADASWTSPTDGQIYFDKVSWTALP
jgi:hypothetical protein